MPDYSNWTGNPAADQFALGRGYLPVTNWASPSPDTIGQTTNQWYDPMASDGLFGAFVDIGSLAMATAAGMDLFGALGAGTAGTDVGASAGVMGSTAASGGGTLSAAESYAAGTESLIGSGADLWGVTDASLAELGWNPYGITDPNFGLNADFGGTTSVGGVGGNIGTGLSSGLSTAANLAQLGTGLYGLYQGNQILNAAKSSNPYLSQIQALINNPSSVTSLPGYTAGMTAAEQALTRNLASQGLTGSGTAAKALTDFGATYQSQAYQQQLQSLMALAGYGTQAAQQQASGLQSGYQTINNSLNSLSKIIPFLGSFGSLFGG